MKRFKKALAFLLSVLIVVCSFPISALAVVNETNDGNYSTDYDVEMHMAVIDYTARNEWGYDSSDLFLTGDAVKSLSRDQLASEDGTFAVVFYVTGLDTLSSFYCMWNIDTTQVTNAYIDRREIVTGVDAAQDSVLGTFANDFHEGTGSTLDGFSVGNLANGREVDKMLLSATLTDGELSQDFDLSWGDEAMIVPGIILGVVGFQMVADGPVDLTQAIYPDMRTVGQQISPIYADQFALQYIYGVVTSEPNPLPDGTYEPQGVPEAYYTKYAAPQWGLMPTEEEPEPQDVTYTYNFADGGSTEVTAPAGEAPTAPDNTAAKVESNGDGTHTTTTYTWPAWEEGTLTYDEVATPVQADCDLQLTTPEVPATHTTPGTTAVYTCSVCGYTTGGDVIEPDADNHDWQLKETVPSTCSTQGYKEYTCECGETMREDLALDPSNHEGPMEDIPAVEATCVVEGFTAGEKCSACGVTTVEPESLGINPDNHKNVVTDEAVAATCVSTGLTEGSHCADCDATIVAQTETPVDPENHVGPFVSADNAVAPTKGEDGHEADTICEACGTTTEYGAVIPATGVQITVEQSELGTSTINSEATTGEAQKVPYGKNYTLVATPSDDAEFVGWQVNGKLISTDTTYTTAAYADLTYTPVFAEKTNDFTVTFVDQFNMVLDTVTGSELADLEALPTPYDYLGYTFSGWSMTLEEVKALETNAVVTACYDKDEVTYTVNAPGCTITVGGETYYDTAVVGFDEGVTVAATDETATAWTVNGANASYGSEYTFFVTSDVTVGYTTDEVTAEPTVAAVDTTLTDNGKVRFLATRNVPAGYTLLESGFVYGKDVVDPEASLVLENVNNTCYLYKNSNMAGDGQFALTFGITSQTGVAYARAYVIAADVNGNSAVYYADVQSYDYDA